MRLIDYLWNRGKRGTGQEGTPAGTESAEPGSVQPRFRVNPFVNFLMRASGEWPLSGPPPLTPLQYRALFKSDPSFVDYVPVCDYLDDEEAYVFNDGVNVAKIWRVQARYMCARSEDALAKFNEGLTRALDSLPVDGDTAEFPYVVQVFARAVEADGVADDFEAAIAENGLTHDPLSRDIARVMRKHLKMMTHEKGVFPDTRIRGETQGWRVADQAVWLCIYSKRPKKYWKKNKRSPAAQTKHDLSAFVNALTSAGISLRPLKPHEFVNWLAPYFGHERVTADDLQERRKMASFDLAQEVFHYAPLYHESNEPQERGIWQFGDDTWLRYLTIGSVDHPPRDGATTLGMQEDDIDGKLISASLFEQLPTGAMMTWTIIPQSAHQMQLEIDTILNLSQDGASRRAKYATEQALEVHEEMMRYNRRVFYVQMGVFLRARSLHDLLDVTERAVAVVSTSDCISIVPPQYDLISQDSFIRALPTVYDFAHDRKSALRARKCYTAHLASLLPFYGNKSGGVNPCYLMYSRTGEPFYLNPFHRNDRSRVSHEVFFGPTGSGKSATIVNMTAMSMAVNNPRMFIFDYGESFKLLADYAERHGKKVKRFVLNANSDDVLAPFFETEKALAEAAKAKAISDGTWKGSPEDKDGDETERRSYLNEMEYILRIMVSGGNNDVTLTPSQIARLNTALVRGLNISKEKGEAHARPIHMMEALLEMADEEAKREGSMREIVLELRDRAEAVRLWTQGLRGMLFNREAKGFDPDYDLTVIELGNVAGLGSEDMLAVAGLSAIYTITALAEKLQHSGRAIEVKIDEAHLWAKVKLLMSGLVVGSKVFRKLNCWLTIITQDVTDFVGDAIKLLANAEFWWLMKMAKTEIDQLAKVRELDPETRYLLDFPRKEGGRFVEGISLSVKYPPTLVRYVPPSLILALGQTDGNEKDARRQLMEKHHIGELDAALLIADEIDAARLRYQLGDDYVPELRETAETEEPAVSIAASDTTISDDALLPAQSDEDATPAEAPREPVLSLVKQIAAAQPEDRQDGDVIPVPHDDEADNSHEPVENAPDAVATASVAVDEEQHLSQDDHIPTRQEES
jgi:conjugative transfer ATPase, PFL_4706 family